MFGTDQIPHADAMAWMRPVYKMIEIEARCPAGLLPRLALLPFQYARTLERRTIAAVTSPLDCGVQRLQELNNFAPKMSSARVAVHDLNA